MHFLCVVFSVCFCLKIFLVSWTNLSLRFSLFLIGLVHIILLEIDSNVIKGR